MALLDSLPSLTSLLGIIVVGYLVYSAVIYPFFFSPLRHVPRAHWSVPFPYVGSLWILHQRYQCRNNQATFRAHKEHGEVVRLGYNELSVSCVDNGIRTIYGGGWEKHEWYPRMFAGYNVINMFSTVHHTPHSQKKRVLANIYSKSYLQTSPQLRANSHELLTHRFLPFIQSASDSSKAVNVHEMNNSFTMDFMTAYQFGIAASTNFTQQTEIGREYLHKYHSRRPWEFVVSEIPPQLHSWLGKFNLSLKPQLVVEANQWLEEWNSNVCDKIDAYLRRMEEASVSEEEKSKLHVGDEPLVYRQFKNGMDKLRMKDPNAGREILPHIMDTTHFMQSNEGIEKMKQLELRSEMLDHLGAGHETSAVALTYLYYELSRNPEIQEKLHEEVTTQLSPALKWPSNPDETSLPEPKMIDALPYLHAVLMETLRLHAPIPGMEPRVSPMAGNHKLGRFSGIPGGVRVSSMPYTLHRNATVFPDPESFVPERWLSQSQGGKTTDEQLKEMHRWFWAFGSGGRMCIGSHLAIQEIKLLVSAIYSNWRSEVFDDEGIQELDAYTTRPQSNKLMLKFIHR